MVQVVGLHAGFNEAPHQRLEGLDVVVDAGQQHGLRKHRHTGIDDPGRVEFRGRAALEDAFNARGKASFDHDVVALVQRGPHCLFEGAVNNLPGGGSGSFISSLSLAADGTIRRYVSFYCEPGIPRS